MTGTVVVALGGNAITAEGEAGTPEQQRANTDAMVRSICELLDDGWRVVIVHGNGPQVGNLAIQQDRGRDVVPEMPLFEDPAFERPTKPIGPFFTKAEATRLAETHGWEIVEDSGRGYRRVVPSPRPRGLVEIDAVRCLLDAGHVVVALVLVTGVESVMLEFGTDSQRRLGRVDVAEVEGHLAAGQFPEGSMGPKVRAATRFLRQGGGLAVITTASLAAATLRSQGDGDATLGTRILPTLDREGVTT
ncbi:MAG: carbamate kinase [Jiangellaceae bacterium]